MAAALRSAICEQNSHALWTSAGSRTRRNFLDRTRSAAGSGGNGRGRLSIGRAEETEEVRFRADDHPRLAAFQSGLIGLHRTVEGEKIGVLAIGRGENAVSFRVACASRLVGLLLSIAEQHHHIAIGLGPSGLRNFGALSAIFRRLARPLALHPA